MSKIDATPSLVPDFATVAYSLPIPPTAVSRKPHGTAGTFDIDLPLTGAAGIECRSGGANNDYQVVLTFANPLAGVDGVRVSDGTATVSHSAIGADPRQYVVDLTGVANAQTITLSLVGVNDGISIGDVSVPMSVLIGDTSASRVVSNTDVAAVKGQVGAPVNAANFRTDVNGNGVLSNSDVSAVKTQAGTTLP